MWAKSVQFTVIICFFFATFAFAKYPNQACYLFLELFADEGNANEFVCMLMGMCQ